MDRLEPMPLRDAQRLFPTAIQYATTIRRRLHQIPELNYQEHQTAALIRHELDAMNIAWSAPVPDAPTATIAVVGEATKPCVALRADIDALPIDEESDLPYRSQRSGCMHACGHDGHSAALLGATQVLKALEHDLPVSLKLIFQPAEESGGGAERLVKAGVCDGRIGPRPEVIFGLHGWPGLELNKISTRHGAILAAMDNFLISIHGRGAHGAYPHLSRDPIAAAAEAILSLQQIVSREIDPIDPAVLTIGHISAGSANNIIPAKAFFGGTVRTLSSTTRHRMREAVYRRVEGVCRAHDLHFDMEWIDGYPPTVNDPAVADYVRKKVADAFGDDVFIPSAAATMGGEDFAYYLEQIPGCFILVGLCPPETQYPSLHNPRFDFNDEALPQAIRLLVELAVGWTGR